MNKRIRYQRPMLINIKPSKLAQGKMPLARSPSGCLTYQLNNNYLTKKQKFVIADTIMFSRNLISLQTETPTSRTGTAHSGFFDRKAGQKSKIDFEINV